MIEKDYFRITILVGVVVGSFLVCWFPFAIMFAGTPFNASIGKFFEDNHLQDIATWIGKRSWLHYTQT